MRTFAWVVGLVLLLVPSWSGLERLPRPSAGAPVTATPLAARAAVGRPIAGGALTYLQGWELRSDDPAFGGYSAMTVDRRGMTLLSDGGVLLHLRLPLRRGPVAARFGELPNGPGTGWEKRDRDSESLQVLPDGSHLVGFEYHHQIWRYAADWSRAIGAAAPRPMLRWQGNGGAEGMVVLRDGGVLVFSEGVRRRGRRETLALRFSGDPTRPGVAIAPFYVRSPDGYAISDAAELPDGRVLLLQRRFDAGAGFNRRTGYSLGDGFHAILSLIDVDRVRQGAVLTGRVVARLDGPLPGENYEAMAIVQEGEHMVLWIVSDDNGGFLQRTLLLKFRLGTLPDR